MFQPSIKSLFCFLFSLSTQPFPLYDWLLKIWKICANDPEWECFLRRLPALLLFLPSFSLLYTLWLSVASLLWKYVTCPLFSGKRDMNKNIYLKTKIYMKWDFIEGSRKWKTWQTVPQNHKIWRAAMKWLRLTTSIWNEIPTKAWVPKRKEWGWGSLRCPKYS